MSLAIKGLRSHGRYAFSPIVQRPKYKWPNGSLLAVYIGLNVEEFSYHHPGSLGACIGGTPPDAQKEPDILNWGWRDYGNRVGVWRMLSIFDELKLPVSALVNAAVYETAPAVTDALAARGYEIVGHGWSNAERQGAWDEATESKMIGDVTAYLTQRAAAKPAGWLGPWISQSPRTLDLLAEAGYAYTMDWAMDDQPVRMRVRGGQDFFAVPYNHEICDIPAILAQKVTASEYGDILRASADEMHRNCETDGIPRVLSLPLHPFLCGQPFRAHYLRQALESIVQKPVWFATAADIVAHVRSLPEGTIPS